MVVLSTGAADAIAQKACKEVQLQHLSYIPRGYAGEIDSYLSRLVKELRRVLSRTQRTFGHQSLFLGRSALEELAGILVDFAIDVHCGIGICESYEACNREWFGTALPMSVREGEEVPPKGIDPTRILHLLWVLYPELKEGLILAPFHRDLLRMVDAVQPCLDEGVSRLPRDAGAKQFLATPNRYGWDVKRKLVWLGTQSYLFRLPFRNYVERECDGKADVEHTDDFICSQCTPWSGLGAVDILARILDIGDDDRCVLRGWYERHMAPYKVLSASSATFGAVNVISNEQYVVRLDMEDSPFREGQFIYGSLVPWRGEWYWSGTQRMYRQATQEMIDDARDHFIRQMSHVVCRYWKDYEHKVRERTRELHEGMMEFYGTDLIRYPDGLSMAADWQREFRRQFESKPKEQVEAVIARHGLKDGLPRISLPDDLLHATGGIGVFLNPDEGKEIMREFDLLTTAFERKGIGLTEDEADVVRGFIQSDAVSPRFVRRMVEEHGSESIRAAFMLPEHGPGYWLEYLLRRHKGHFYRRRYPSLSIV